MAEEWCRLFNAISLPEFVEYHFERRLKNALVKHHRLLCFVKIPPVDKCIFVLCENVTNTVVEEKDAEVMWDH